MKYLASLLLLAFVTTSLSQSELKVTVEKACKGFLPENTLWIGPHQKSRFGGLNQAQFNAVIDAVEAIYAPIVADKGGKLQINRKWDNGTVNANASRQGSTYVVNMYGGLARHRTVTADGFALVVCHELGHHIGGSPVYGGSGGGSGWGGGVNNWASNEGQSDYFATTKCLRKLFRNFNNFAAIKRQYSDIPQFVTQSCKAQFNNETDFMVCVRTAMAGLSLANLFRDLRNMKQPLSFQTPDTRVVSKTYDGHPQPQCRLDTYFQGAVCGEDYREDLEYKDEAKGACARVKGDKLGTRPLCWYKPQKSLYGNQFAYNY
jgi:hypothetical protein